MTNGSPVSPTAPVPADPTKPEPTGRVIEGGVAAVAGPAEASVNGPGYVTEVPHHRIVGDVRHTMTEYVPENGSELPPAYQRCSFWGHGMLQAETDLGPMKRAYQFPVLAGDLAEAWRNFDACLQRAAAQEETVFRADYHKLLVERARQMQDPGLAVVQGQAADRVLRGAGRGSLPSGGGGIITP